MEKVTVPIKGMHCRSCELLIEEALKNIPDVKKVDVSYRSGKVDLYFKKGASLHDEAIYQAVKDAGYDVGARDKVDWISKDENDYNYLLNGAIILILLYFLAKQTGILDYSVNTESTSLFVVLMVGLVAGVSTCMALVGGLVLSISARHAEAHPEITAKEKFRPHIYFNLGRVLGFGFFGGVLAMIGSVAQPSTNVLGLMTIVIGGVMIFLGLKLIEIFPFMKEMSISLPKGVSKMFGIKKEQKEYSHKGAFISGALTFFLPCGFTQAMQLYAVGSGGFVNGALIMSMFALGTAPGLLGVGGLSSIFKGKNARTFFATTGLAVIILGWFNITNGSQLVFQGRANSAVNVASDSSEVQEVKMTQSGSGYSPSQFTVEKGKKVRWIITSTNQFSCASSIVMPKYGISKGLKKGENIIEFVPTETGEIPFSCSMGMYRGKFIVVEAGSAAASGAKSSDSATTTGNKVASSGGCGGGGGGCGGCGGGAKKEIDSETTPSVKDDNVQVIKAEYTLAKDISPNRFEVKKGVPVRFEVDVKESGQGCMSSLKVSGLYDKAQYLEGGKKMILSFTPEKEGEYNIACAMGVPRGVIKVVN